MTLPNLPDLVSGTTTEGDFQAAMTLMYNHIAQSIGAEDPENVDIVLGSITPTKALVKIDTENSSATDDLDHIIATNLDQRLIMIQSTDPSRTIVLKHNISGSGKLLLLDDIDVELTDTKQYVILRHNSSDDSWYELDRNFGFLAPTATIKAALRAKLGLTDIVTKAIGTASGQVPTADLLGALAFMSTVGTDQIVDDAITGAKILAGSISLAKIANGTPGYFMGFNDTTGVAEEKQLVIAAPNDPEIFTSGGTWTKPVGFTGKIRVTVQAGGGGGGGTTNGGTGGSSSFGAHVTATGGAGGTTAHVGGAGGSFSNADWGSQGSDGGNGYARGEISNNSMIAGCGGNSFMGGGGRGRSLYNSSGGEIITNTGGNLYGGGGGGYALASNTGSKGAFGGGGGGGCAFKVIDATTLGATETVTVGGGGGGGSGASSGAAGIVIVEYLN